MLDINAPSTQNFVFVDDEANGFVHRLRTKRIFKDVQGFDIFEVVSVRFISVDDVGYYIVYFATVQGNC